jgi:hypothetical protein
MALIKTGKVGKGKNFSNEECQLCKNFLHISQNLVIDNGQRTNVFWEGILVHYNHNRPGGCDERLRRLLEMKWRAIKYDMANFCNVFKAVVSSRELGTSTEDMLNLNILNNPLMFICVIGCC